MGEKKRHNQSSNNPPGDGSGSSESGDSREPSMTPSGTKGNCPHLNKAVDQAAVRRNFKSSGQLGQFTCTDCKKSIRGTQVLKCKDPWVCLRCGTCCCGPTEKNHINSHYSTPRSDMHVLALSLREWTVLCFQCNLEIPVDCNKKIGTSVKTLKQHYDKHLQAIPNDVSETITTDKKVEPPESSDKMFLVTNSIDVCKIKPVPSNLLKVRGLLNLGNTCFFNSVLQCLAQTPGLVELLREMEIPGEKFMMPLKETESVCAELDKGVGSISEALASVLIEVSGYNRTDSGDKDNSNFVVNPKQLLSALRKKCAQFEGSDQHDAHELLRHLLDSVRMEDLRRYHRAILNHFGLSTKESPKEMDVSKRDQAKAMNQQVCESVLIRPDHLFKGLLMSRLECQTCHHSSERVESFLDLSLPVTPEKPQPPSVTRRKYHNHGGTNLDSEPHWKTKQECINEEKTHKKLRRKKQSSHNVNNTQGEATIAEEDKKDLVSVAEPSDADVEDNEDGGCDEQEHRLEVLESGYSSEKQASPRASPLTHSPGEDSDTFLARPQSQKRSESGLGSSTVSIQELTVMIPDSPPQLNVDLASPNSTQANASPGSQEVSSDSLQNEKQFGCDNRNDDILIRRYNVCNTFLPSSDNCFNSNAVVYGWECNPFPDSKKSDSDSENVKCLSHNSNDSSSISIPNTPPGGDSSVSRSSQDVNMNCSTKGSPESQRETTLPDNSPLNSLKAIDAENSQQEERPVSRLEFHGSLARSSPVELVDSAGIDSAVLNLQLEFYKTEKAEENTTDDIPPLYSLLEQSDEELTKMNESCNILQSEHEMGFVLVGGIAESKSKIPEIKNNPIDVSPPTEEVVLQNGPVTLGPRYKCDEGECSLQSCLYQFTAIEIMTGNNKVGCETCTARQARAGNKDSRSVYTACTKQLLISSIPPIMIFHFKRFQVQMCSFRKIFRHVKFPLILDIAPFCSTKCKSVIPGQTQILYSLYGVVEHSGTLHGGHYVAYVKVRPKNDEQGSTEPKPGKWYHVSDSRVNEVNENKVLNTEAYLLFYERFL